MRRVLDGIYATALIAACLALVAIALMVGAQIIGRIADRTALAFGGQPFGFVIPGLSEYGGFLFVAAATLALPAALREGGHVRVTLLAGFMRGVAGRIATTAVLGLALGLAGWAAWHLGAQALDSWRFNSRSFGMVRTPLWGPQAVLALGFGLMALAVLDELSAVITGRSAGFQRAEAQRSTERGAGGH
jgi:TRAP-type C4-dicarboxylate transport system permease small subunit